MRLTERSLLGRPEDLAAENREIRRLRAQVAAVMELHAIDESKAQWGDKVCKGCATHVTYTPWPCATVKALEVTA